MRKITAIYLLVFALVCACTLLQAQNWNVFNKNFRYNYKFDNSALISNVLFVDTVKQVGTDTIYSMNRIAVECTANCPVVPNSAPTSTAALYLDMPQFLQRKIKKYSNGMVMLQDTSKIVILPHCTLNQTWLFDSIANLTATCVVTNTQTVFGIVDSVKTILINADTLKLSKNFGILVYPKPYAVNKYYRLAGIELSSSYDLTALHGEKVPNAWDFFNFNVGDVFTRKSSYYYKINGTVTSAISFQTFTIQSKNITANSYSYGISYIDQSGVCYPGIIERVHCDEDVSSLCNATVSAGTSALEYSNLSSPLYYENRMYPGMYQFTSLNTFSFISVGGCFPVINITKFGKDNLGRFYKYMGKSCPHYTSPIMPNSSAIDNYDYTGNYAYLHHHFSYQYCIGSGVGTVNNNCTGFEHGSNYVLSNAIINGTTYYGQPWTVGLKENLKNLESVKLYPNPTNDFVQIDVEEPANYQIVNVLGAAVLKGVIEPGVSLNTRTLAPGVYIVLLQQGIFSRTAKLVIER